MTAEQELELATLRESNKRRLDALVQAGATISGLDTRYMTLLLEAILGPERLSETQLVFERQLAPLLDQFEAGAREHQSSQIRRMLAGQ